jgi:hypothetical protein
MAARYRNGWEDDGTPLKHGAKKCPACGSARFVETISREYCPACGIECDYWGAGANAKYESWVATTHAIEERRREEKFQAELQQERDAWEAMNHPTPGDDY